MVTPTAKSQHKFLLLLFRDQRDVFKLLLYSNHQLNTLHLLPVITREKHQILTLNKLEPTSVKKFSSNQDRNDYLVIKIELQLLIYKPNSKRQHFPQQLCLQPISACSHAKYTKISDYFI